MTGPRFPILAGVVLVGIGLVVVALGAAPKRPDPAELVVRLGSARYAEREAATKALRQLRGESLPALRRARDARDAEVRVRVRALLEEIEVPALARQVEEVLGWLPMDTETIVVAGRPFRIGGEEAPREVRDPGVSSQPFEQFLQALVIEDPFASAGPGPLPRPSIVSQLTGKRVSVAVFGSRRPRQKGGEVRSEGCRILWFEEDLGRVGDDLMSNLARRATESVVLSRHRVVIVDDRRTHPDAVPFCIAWPRPDLLLMATDLRYLAEALERLARPGPVSGRALPPDLPEWSQLDPTARCWAVRHYDRQSGRLDPTSPLNWQPALAGLPRLVPNVGAPGLVISSDLDNQVRIRYLSLNRVALGGVLRFWTLNRDLGPPQLRLETPGVVEITFPHRPVLNSQDPFYFQIACALGHAALTQLGDGRETLPPP